MTGVLLEAVLAAELGWTAPHDADEFPMELGIASETGVQCRLHHVPTPPFLVDLEEPLDAKAVSELDH